MRNRAEDHYGAHRPAPASMESLPLFGGEPSVPAWATTWSSLTDDQRKAQRERWKELLRPIVRALVRRRGPEGIIAGDVIAEGITGGILWGERSFVTKYPRVYAWVGPWLGQLAAEGVIAAKTEALASGRRIQVTRRSDRSLSHGNEGGVFVALEFAA